MVEATRVIICRTLTSRSGVPLFPRKYFCTTILVAVCDQSFGISTPFCSKIVLPFSLVIFASLISHATWSYGCPPSFVQRRVHATPVRVARPCAATRSLNARAEVMATAEAPLPFPLPCRCAIGASLSFGSCATGGGTTVWLRSVTEMGVKSDIIVCELLGF